MHFQPFPTKALSTGFLLLLLFASACIVQHPKYIMVDKVMHLRTGMTMAQVDSALIIPPHNLKEMTDSGTFTYTYKMRTNEVSRIPFLMKKNSGVPARGPYIDLFITYNTDSVVTHLSTCANCDQTREKTVKINPSEIVNAITTVISVTIPALLVFIAANTKN